MVGDVIAYMPIDLKEWRLAMAPRPLDESNWLDVDENRATELAQKNQLLCDAYATVVATTAHALEGSGELFATVRVNLQKFHPEPTVRTS